MAGGYGNTDDGSGGFFAQNLGPWMDPRQMAWMGFAQGFGRAAMPSRLPVPTGAVLGMGAEGAMSGADQAFKNRLVSSEATGKNIGNANELITLNMWRQMMGQPPLSAADLAAGRIEGSPSGGKNGAKPGASAASSSGSITPTPDVAADGIDTNAPGWYLRPGAVDPAKVAAKQAGGSDAATAGASYSPATVMRGMPGFDPTQNTFMGIRLPAGMSPMAYMTLTRLNPQASGRVIGNQYPGPTDYERARTYASLNPNDPDAAINAQRVAGDPTYLGTVAGKEAQAREGARGATEAFLKKLGYRLETGQEPPGGTGGPGGGSSPSIPTLVRGPDGVYRPAASTPAPAPAPAQGGPGIQSGSAYLTGRAAAQNKMTTVLLNTPDGQVQRQMTEADAADIAAGKKPGVTIADQPTGPNQKLIDYQNEKDVTPAQKQYADNEQTKAAIRAMMELGKVVSTGKATPFIAGDINNLLQQAGLPQIDPAHFDTNAAAALYKTTNQLVLNRIQTATAAGEGSSNRGNMLLMRVIQDTKPSWETPGPALQGIGENMIKIIDVDQARHKTLMNDATTARAKQQPLPANWESAYWDKWNTAHPDWQTTYAKEFASQVAPAGAQTAAPTAAPQVKNWIRGSDGKLKPAPATPADAK